jgi:hypothetical protein
MTARLERGFNALCSLVAGLYLLCALWTLVDPSFDPRELAARLWAPVAEALERRRGFAATLDEIADLPEASS